MNRWFGSLIAISLIGSLIAVQTSNPSSRTTQPKSGGTVQQKPVSRTTQKPAASPQQKRTTTQSAKPASRFVPPTLPPLPDPNKVVATVNGEPIRAGELVRATYDWYGAQALEELIFVRVIEQEARKQKITVKPEEVEASYKQQLQNAEANLPPGMSLNDFLRRNTYPPSRLYPLARARVLAEKLAEKRINLDNFIKYSQILIRIQGSTPEEQEKNAAAAEAKAKEAYQKISEGLDFGEAAKQYSEDPFTRDRGGQLEWQYKRFIVPDVLQQLEKLKPGQVSQPFRTLGAYMIVRLERTGSQAKGDELRQIRQQAVQLELNDLVAQLRSRAKITNTIVKPLTPEQMMGGAPRRPAPRVPAARPPAPRPPQQPRPEPQPRPEGQPRPEQQPKPDQQPQQPQPEKKPTGGE